jgi:hypothetical protein
VLFASVQGLNQPVDARIADLQRQMVLAQSSHAPRRLGRQPEPRKRGVSREPWRPPVKPSSRSRANV